MEIDIQAILDRQYKTTKWLIVSLIVSVIALLATNLTWVWLFNQYDYVTTTETTYTIEQDGEGFNVIDGSFNERE